MEDQAFEIEDDDIVEGSLTPNIKATITVAKTILKELAEAIGIRQQTVSLYKNGETHPTPETLVSKN